MITETSLYWVLKLDSIRNLFGGINCLFIVFSVIAAIPLVIGTVVYYIAETEHDHYHDHDYGFRKVLMLGYLLEAFFVFAAISSAICNVLIPSTKEYAMIKVIPMVANSTEFKELKGDAKELYKLGIEATKSKLKSLALTKDEPKNGK
jgi:hypothetical protein